MQQSNINIRNKKASYNYELLEKFVCGIILTGTEIKSIRLGKASIIDTFCYLNKEELWVKNMNISEYFYGNFNNHIARRDRKLLLTKQELKKIIRLVKETAHTIVPTRLFISDKGYAKLVIYVAKGKKEYDKRHSIKEKEDKRTMDRAYKSKIR